MSKFNYGELLDCWFQEYVIVQYIWSLCWRKNAVI